MSESEKRKAYRAEWAKKAYAENPEKFRKYAREQHHKHVDKRREKAAKYRAENKERLREQNKKWREANTYKVRANNLRRIGFTPEMFDEMMAYQEGLCAVCGVELSSLPTKNVHADHCHTTGTARGILCHHCNSALGLLREDPILFEKAVAYLLEPTAVKMRRKLKC